MSFSTFRSDLQSFKADLHNSLYVDIGEQAQFTHRGGSPVTVNVWPKGKSPVSDIKPLGVRSQQNKQTFLLPVQTNFSGGTDSVVRGDTIAWNGDTFVIKDMEWDAFDAVITLNTVMTTGLSIQVA